MELNPKRIIFPFRLCRGILYELTNLSVRVDKSVRDVNTSEPCTTLHSIPKINIRGVCKVRGLTLLLRIGILRRCGDGLFSKYPLTSDALLTTLHPILENVLQTVDHFEISCLGAPFSWLEKPRNCMG
jgi:hypothetical protein